MIFILDEEHSSRINTLSFNLFFNKTKPMPNTTAKEKISLMLEGLVEKYKYRPLPKEVSESSRRVYSSHLNGFESEVKKKCTINGVLICSNYDRVVIGDYGAYLEFDPKDLLVELTVPTNQKWRLNKEYVQEKGLSIKYEWYEYNGVKVYLQLATVKYADYLPGKYYIWVLDFDNIF